MLLLILAAAPPALQSPPPTAATDCPRTTSHYAVRPGQRLKPRMLTELPSANAFAAVYRHVGGCEMPLVVRYGIGKRR